MENVLVRTSWKESWLELERASVETTKGWQVSRESDGKRVGRGWKVRRESDGKRVGIQMCDWAGRSCGVGKQGKTRVRAREEPMVRRCGGMAHPCQASHDMALRHQGCTWG